MRLTFFTIIFFAACHYSIQQKNMASVRRYDYSVKFFDSVRKVNCYLYAYMKDSFIIADYNNIQDTLKIFSSEMDKNGENIYYRANSKANDLSYLTRDVIPIAITFNNKLYYPEPIQNTK